MISYIHKNTSIDPPLLSRETFERYKRLLENKPLVAKGERTDYLAESLVDIAERLECDLCATSLKRVGVDAQVVDNNNYNYHENAVRVGFGAYDSQAASRIIQRISAGLPVKEAIARTHEQCDKPTLTEHELIEKENAANAHVRRVLFEQP